MSEGSVAPGFKKYIKAESLGPVDKVNHFNPGAKHEVIPAPQQSPLPDMNDPIHKRTTEGDSTNAQNGKGTWKPQNVEERNQLSDKLADKATNLLKDIPTIGGPQPVPAWKQQMKKR